MCEEGRRCQKKDDFKVCQQKTARTSVNCTALYSTSCVFINAPPAIRPHLAQLLNNHLKHSFKLILFFFSYICSAAALRSNYSNSFTYERVSSHWPFLTNRTAGGRSLFLDAHTSEATILVCESRDYWHRHLII